MEFIAEHGHVVDAPGLKREHYSVFDCAMGERSIAPMGHVRMMAAVQPFISGAISKTVNMPEDASVADVAEIYQQGWKMGLKALAIYRDNCKVGQPLSASNKNHGEKSADVSVVEAVTAPAPVVTGPVRRRLPKKRPSQTVSFTVGGAEGYLTTGSYPDDGLGEVFIKLGKQGSTLAGVMDAFSIAVSVGLQYGIPLESYVAKFTNLRFEPAGMTDDPDVRIATSVMDYLFRRIALDYLPVDARAELGIFSAEERVAQVSSSYGAESGSETAHVVEDLRTTVDATPVIRPAVEGGTSTVLPATAPGETAASTELKGSATRSTGGAGSSTELLEMVIGKSADAPLCFTCGTRCDLRSLLPARGLRPDLEVAPAPTDESPAARHPDVAGPGASTPTSSSAQRDPTDRLQDNTTGSLSKANICIPARQRGQALTKRCPSRCARGTSRRTVRTKGGQVFGYLGAMRTRPGQRDEVVAILLRDVEQLRGAGAHLYVVGLDDDDPDLIRVNEVWDSKESHHASLRLPQVQAAIAEAMPMLTGEFTGHEMTIVGGLGLTG